MRSLTLAQQLLRHYSKDLAQRALKIWSEHGWKGLLGRSIDAWQHKRPIEEFYAEWIRRYDTLTERSRRDLRSDMADWASRPLLSVIMSIGSTDPRLLKAAARSISRQLYPHWELCISADAATFAGAREELLSMAQEDRRIRIPPLEESGACAGLNSALSLASGEFIVLFEAPDLLPEHALYWVAKEIIEHPETDLIFSDEDKIDASGNRSSPCFKPDWNPALMLSCNAFGHLGIVRRSLVEKVGGFRPELDGSRDYDLVLRCAKQTPAARIRHIPRILYHQRAPAPAAGELDARSDALEAGRRAVEDHLATSGIRATVEQRRPAILSGRIRPALAVAAREHPAAIDLRGAAARAVPEVAHHADDL